VRRLAGRFATPRGTVAVQVERTPAGLAIATEAPVPIALADGRELAPGRHATVLAAD
jgi:hypothetical protein